MAFVVGSDVASAARTTVPQFRLRLNESSFHAATFVAVESVGSALRSPVAGEMWTYVVYFLPPPAAAGQSLLLSFDFLNLEPQDRSDATLFLDEVRIYSLPAKRVFPE